jgi:outer membrane protein TolC
VALNAARLEAVLSARKLALEKQIATAYYQLGFIRSSEKINERLFALVSQLLKVAETRYATGRGLQKDVLQAQVELSKLIDEKIMLSKKHRTMEDMINAMLNRDSFAAIAPPEGLPHMNLILDLKDLKDRAMKQHPWLHAKQADIDQAAIDVELARKDYFPDMNFKVAYGQRDTSRKGPNWVDFISASVMVNVPLWHKTRQDRKLAAKGENHEAALDSYGNLAARLPHRIDSLAFEIQSIQESYGLFKDALIIQAAQLAQASLSAYEVGRLEFNTMINAQMRLLRMELMADMYLFNSYKKRAELEALIGGPLPEQIEGNPSLPSSLGRSETGVSGNLAMTMDENRTLDDSASVTHGENDR